MTIGGCNAAVTAGLVVAQSAAPTQASSAQRYEIVNGTPDLAANIMLLDTTTGESWVICSSPDSSKSGASSRGRQAWRHRGSIPVFRGRL
jgi:hypothetical protein